MLNYQVNNNETNTANKDFIMEVDDSIYIVLKVYCTIVRDKSISYYIDVLYPDLYEQYKEEFQNEIDTHMGYVKNIARELNVPFITL